MRNILGGAALSDFGQASSQNSGAAERFYHRSVSGLRSMTTGADAVLLIAECLNDYHLRVRCTT